MIIEIKTSRTTVVAPAPLLDYGVSLVLYLIDMNKIRILVIHFIFLSGYIIEN